jgi:hypothetical protein
MSARDAPNVVRAMMLAIAALAIAVIFGLSAAELVRVLS